MLTQEAIAMTTVSCTEPSLDTDESRLHPRGHHALSQCDGPADRDSLHPWE